MQNQVKISENSYELKQLIRENSKIFWYIKENAKENLSLPVVVEFFLNYADEKNTKRLFKIVGIDIVADIFFKDMSMERRKGNYLPLVAHYYNLYFKKHAHKNIK